MLPNKILPDIMKPLIIKQPLSKSLKTSLKYKLYSLCNYFTLSGKF